MSYNSNSSNEISNQSTIILSGAISVKAAIEAGVRKTEKIWIDEKKHSKDFSYILKLAQTQKIPVQKTNRQTIDQLTQTSSHGGICAQVCPRIFLPAEQLLNHQNPFIVLLEGIEDPYNFGYTIRSVYAAGATGLLIPQRSWMSADDIVIRASAGASERIPTACVTDFTEVLLLAKQKGFSIFSADRKDAVSLYDADFTNPLILAIGGQLRGLSKQVSQQTDQRVFIPYGNPFRNALSAAGAASVLAFEVYRQRMQTPAAK